MIAKKGFTLIELLLVMTIFAVLAGVTLVAINPSKNISEANDVQRRSDVKAIIDAVGQYAIENRGQYPSAITNAAGTIGDNDGEGEIDICDDLVPDFLAELPVDPTATDAAYNNCTEYNTGYTILQGITDRRITVTAPNAEEDTISLTR